MSDPVSIAQTSYDVAASHWTIVRSRGGEVVFSRPGGAVGLIVDSDGYRDAFERLFPLLVLRWGTGPFVVNVVVDNSALGRIGSLVAFWEAPDAATAAQARREIAAGLPEPSFVTNKVGACAPGPKSIRVCSGDVSSAGDGERSVVGGTTVSVDTPVEAQPVRNHAPQTPAAPRPTFPQSYRTVAGALWGMIYHANPDFPKYATEATERVQQALAKHLPLGNEIADLITVESCPDWMAGEMKLTDLHVKALAFIGEAGDDELLHLLSMLNQDPTHAIWEPMAVTALRLHHKLTGEAPEDVLASVAGILLTSPYVQTWHYGRSETNVLLNRILRAFMILLSDIHQGTPESISESGRRLILAILTVFTYSLIHVSSCPQAHEEPKNSTDPVTPRHTKSSHRRI